MKDIKSLLVTKFGVSSEDLDKALAYQVKYSGRIEQVLVNMGGMPSDLLPEYYAELLERTLLNESDFFDWLPPQNLTVLPLQELVHNHWIPLKQEDDKWLFATSNPFSKEAVEILTSRQVTFDVNIANPELISILEGRLNISGAADDKLELSSFEESKLRELASEAPTVNLLNSLITRALRVKASDMHLEPHLGKAKVRFRVDGVLQDVETIPSVLVLPVITRLKILSNMDIAEKRRPQDGKIEMRISGTDLDIRVSALPLNDGESVVMRFLRKDAIQYDMSVLGIASDIEQQIVEDLQTTAGVILLTGPTGSGKTTSLYTFLNKLNTPGVKIITLEDPVEYQLNGINQVQVQPDIGFDFAAGLRSIVRQDPDVIMLGEIRDKETAAIAMQSALTGHLVFSTVHTNDAPSAYTRLLDLGIEEFLLNAALVSIVAQRLVRKICVHCATPMPNAGEAIEKYQLHKLASRHAVYNITLMQAKGCELCGHSGYRGRLAVIEYLRCDDAIKNIPKNHNFILKARDVHRERGGRTLIEDGLLKAIQGTTTIEEVLRVAG